MVALLEARDERDAGPGKAAHAFAMADWVRARESEGQPARRAHINVNNLRRLTVTVDERHNLRAAN
jgi:hypothetical protein